MTILQGEIWEVNLNPTIGDEMSKIRVCLVVSSDAIGKLKLKTVVPITGWNDRFDEVVWMTKIAPNSTNGLSKPSSADAFQVRSVSVNRFCRKVGKIDGSTLLAIHEAIAKTFDPRYEIFAS